MAEITRKNALQDAELSLIDSFTLVAVENLPQVSLLTLIDHVRDAFLGKDTVDIAILQLELIQISTVVRLSLVRAIDHILPLALQK